MPIQHQKTKKCIFHTSFTFRWEKHRANKHNWSRQRTKQECKTTICPNFLSFDLLLLLCPGIVWLRFWADVWFGPKCSHIPKGPQKRAKSCQTTKSPKNWILLNLELVQRYKCLSWSNTESPTIQVFPVPKIQTRIFAGCS